MKSCLFERFAAMVEKLPAKGVLRAIELECQMLQNDMAQKRTLPLNDARSILAFNDFLKSISAGICASSFTLPIQHISSCRKIVERLIEAGELPFAAKEQFEETFSSSFVKAFVS
jgi:hypothetical protein